MAGEGALPLPAAHGLGSPPFGHQHLLSSYYRPNAPLEVGFGTSPGRCFSASWGRLVEVSGHVGVRSPLWGPLRAPPRLWKGRRGFFCVKVTGLFAETSTSGRERADSRGMARGSCKATAPHRPGHVSGK